MDLNKGGLADSPRPNTAYKSNSRSNSFPSASTTQTSIVPRTKSSETSTKKKSNKRKKDKVEGDGDGQEKGESTSSGSVSKKKKSKNDSTPQAVQPELIRTQTPISHARSTTGEESENASMAPPPLRASQQTSQYRLNGLNAFSTSTSTIINTVTTEEEEGGFIEYRSPLPESRFFPTTRSASHESADGGVQSPSIVQLKEEEQERVEEGGEYGYGVVVYTKEDEVWRDQAEGGQRFSRFSQSNLFASRHFSPRNDYEQTPLSSPALTEPELGEDGENVLRSPAVVQAEEQSPSSPKARAETLAKPEIDPLNPIPSLFSGSNPFFEHAKALARSKGMVVEGDKTVKAEDVVEKVKSENIDFVNRFNGILGKTQSLFERSLARQLELVSKLENHSAQLAKEDKQIKETKDRLANWSGQLLKEGKGEGEPA